MANIQLTQELVQELFDYKDGLLYWKIKPANQYKINIGDLASKIWRLRKTTIYRRCVYIKRVRISSSRVIFLWHNGYLPINVDHINHNTLDDRIENLRAATSSQNNANGSSHRDSTSKYRGVCYLKNKNKWECKIQSEYKKVWVGWFETEIEAAIAYNKAALIYHKEFANLNIIE